MFDRFRLKQKAQIAAVETPAVRVELDLSGPVLDEVLQSLMKSCEHAGGMERYVMALQFKASLFQDALREGPAGMTLPRFLKLAMFMPTVRRKAHPYFTTETYETIARAIPVLVSSDASIDDRLSEFCDAFPDDRDHRWVRDLGAEILHNNDPERCPLMTRWVWDKDTNTGVIREIWHGENIDHMVLDVKDNAETFLALREDLSQFLSAEGVYRDVLWYVDLMCGHVYGRYLAAQGGQFLRTDFGNAGEDLGVHTRRILGLDGVRAKGYDGRDPDQIESDASIMKQLSMIQEG